LASKVPPPEILVNTSSLHVTVGADDGETAVVETASMSVELGYEEGLEHKEGLEGISLVREVGLGLEPTLNREDATDSVLINLMQFNDLTNTENDLTSDASVKNLEVVGEDGYNGNGENIVKSRGKEDIWHMFNALPLARKCIVKGPVMRLLIVCTMLKSAAE
jgi:hypothetical protein